jgi:1-deoxy-D-xylulose-5-phosphate reductoisomerase
VSSRDVVLLGSTGSIGTQAVDLVLRNPDRFRVVALAAGGADPRALARQAVTLDVEQVAVADPAAAAPLADALQAAARDAGRPGHLPEVLAGPDAATEVAGRACDVVLNGMTGSVGLRPTLAALAAGSTLALANKESLIVGGPLVTQAAAPGQIVPVDSEHSALAQCLGTSSRPGDADDLREVRRLVLTASGGPFRGRSRAELAGVTPEQALAHPTWAMGPVVTTNSATLVNKGLEVIEAHLLFGVPFERIDVVVHPQSVVHSMVEFVDGSTLAQASPPDMRLPIALGLSWPERVPDAAPGCDWTRAATWEFLPLDDEAFPAVALAREVGSTGGTAPAVFNAANEECVDAFLAGRIAFLDVVDTVAAVVAEHEVVGARHQDGNPPSLADVLAAESWARRRAHEVLAGTTLAGTAAGSATAAGGAQR